MSIAPVSGIKVPVSFMANKKADEDAKPKIDPSDEVDKFNKEANELGDSLQETGAAVTKVTGSAMAIGTPLYGAKKLCGNFVTNLFKTIEKDADGLPIVKSAPEEIMNKIKDTDGKVIKEKLDQLSAEEAKQVVYQMKNSPWKIGAAIVVGVGALALAVKSVMDKKKAEAAEAEAEKAAEAAEAAKAEAEADTEVEETPEKE